LAQEFDGQEIIVVNDGSTDSTQSVLESYGARIAVIQQENQGPSKARNAAIERATGEYIAFLDADDIWLPGRLSKTVAALEHNPTAGIPLQCRTILASLAHPPSMDEILTHWWPIVPATVTMRRSTWYRCGGFNTEMPAFEDLYLFILARECSEFEYLAEPLAEFRQSGPEFGPDKWRPQIFVRLIRERYRARARPLIAEINNGYAGGFASRALHAMGQGNQKEAMRCWLQVFRYDPLYAFKLVHMRRVFRSHNVKRLARMLWPKPPGEAA
jgi:glycosyltransferase involved in cell wall biosynthesis